MTHPFRLPVSLLIPPPYGHFFFQPSVIIILKSIIGGLPRFLFSPFKTLFCCLYPSIARLSSLSLFSPLPLVLSHNPSFHSFYFRKNNNLSPPSVLFCKTQSITPRNIKHCLCREVYFVSLFLISFNCFSLLAPPLQYSRIASPFFVLSLDPSARFQFKR